MVKRDEDGLWIEHREVIAAHPEEVLACFTTAEGLARWFPVAARIDCRTGGRIELGWDARFEHRTTIAILDYDAGGTMVWDWHASHREQHAPLYWSVQPSVEDGCVVELRQGPFAEEVDSLAAMVEEAQFWTWQVCNLRSVLEVRHDMRAVRPL